MMFAPKEQTGRELVKNRIQKKTRSGMIAVRCVILLLGVALGIFLQYIQGYRPGGEEGLLYVIIPVLIGLSLAASIAKMDEWERAIVLRLGKFYRVRGPGLFFIIPVVDRIARVVDLRIRVSDFTAETTLTKDSVTVTVDALCFWLVWDAEKAVCEVQDYEEAVILSSKTALRSAISSHDLSTFLEKNKTIEEHIQSSVDRKTTEWGITVQQIEITDVQIPQHLQDSLSRMAQAEREKKGRILIAEAEMEIADIYRNAAKIYNTSDTALLLKNLAILNEGLKAGNSMMLVPNSITEKLEQTDIFGLKALQEIRHDAQKPTEKNSAEAGNNQTPGEKS